MKDINEIVENAEHAADFLKVLANRNRLVILCMLSQQEYSVSQLEGLLNIRQPTLSQQLAILRDANVVATRRSEKSIFYRLASPETEAVIGLLYKLFCEGRTDETRRTDGTERRADTDRVKTEA